MQIISAIWSQAIIIQELVSSSANKQVNSYYTYESCKQ